MKYELKMAKSISALCALCSVKLFNSLVFTKSILLGSPDAWMSSILS